MSAYPSYTYVQLLIDNDENGRMASYRWGLAESIADWQHSHIGSEAELMEWLQANSQPMVLIIPGEKVVCHRVPYDNKEKRHFIKALPYEIEDHVMGDVEDLHFSVGLQKEPQASIAYVDKIWFSHLLKRFTDQDIEVFQCIADFQLLSTNDEEMVFWFQQGRLLAHAPDGLGFATSQDLVPVVLQNLLAENPYKLSIYMTDDIYQSTDESQAEETDDYGDIKLLFHTLAPEAECEFYEKLPPVSIENKQNINFCSGLHRKKLPIAQWFNEFRAVALLAAVTVLAFFVVNIVEIVSLKNANEKKQQEIREAYRTVIPRGVVNDPVRQLTRKLGVSSNRDEKPSQSVYLLSIVAPAVKSLDIDMSTINYNNKNRQMSINIQANTFNDVEKLRSDIISKGLDAQLLSSNAVDDKFQARLRIDLGDK